MPSNHGGTGSVPNLSKKLSFVRVYFPTISPGQLVSARDILKLFIKLAARFSMAVSPVLRGRVRKSLRALLGLPDAVTEIGVRLDATWHCRSLPPSTTQRSIQTLDLLNGLKFDLEPASRSAAGDGLGIPAEPYRLA